MFKWIDFLVCFRYRSNCIIFESVTTEADQHVTRRRLSRSWVAVYSWRNCSQARTANNRRNCCRRQTRKPYQGSREWRSPSLSDFLEGTFSVYTNASCSRYFASHFSIAVGWLRIGRSITTRWMDKRISVRFLDVHTIWIFYSLILVVAVSIVVVVYRRRGTPRSNNCRRSHKRRRSKECCRLESDQLTIPFSVLILNTFLRFLIIKKRF